MGLLGSLSPAYCVEWPSPLYFIDCFILSITFPLMRSGNRQFSAFSLGNSVLRIPSSWKRLQPHSLRLLFTMHFGFIFPCFLCVGQFFFQILLIIMKLCSFFIFFFLTTGFFNSLTSSILLQFQNFFRTLILVMCAGSCFIHSVDGFIG